MGLELILLEPPSPSPRRPPLTKSRALTTHCVVCVCLPQVDSYLKFGWTTVTGVARGPKSLTAAPNATFATRGAFQLYTPSPRKPPLRHGRLSPRISSRAARDHILMDTTAMGSQSMPMPPTVMGRPTLAFRDAAAPEEQVRRQPLLTQCPLLTHSARSLHTVPPSQPAHPHSVCVSVRSSRCVGRAADLCGWVAGAAPAAHAAVAAACARAPLARRARSRARGRGQRAGARADAHDSEAVRR